LEQGTEFDKLSKNPTLSAGVDLLTHLFSDKDKTVQTAAIKVCIRRVYRDAVRRNMRPTFYALLELSRLSANFDLERIPAIGRNTQICFGTVRMERPSRAAASQGVFVRFISHSPGQ
jgi:hypothetical protein